MKDKWTPGDHCALRGLVDGRVWLAQSVAVVKDELAETILLLAPGHECAYPEGYWRWGRGDSSAGTRWQEARSPNLRLRKFAWQTNRILMFLEPEKYYSWWLFWNHAADRFSCYYLNFQLPYRRSHCGFDTFDLELDLVISPQFDWHWKDEADYQEGIREGGIRPEWVKQIEQAQPEVFERLQARRRPLDGSWLPWRPDPTWSPPSLPERWDEA